MTKTLKTSYEKEKEDFEMRVYRDWQRLVAHPENKKEAINAYLMEKYNIHAHSTVWRIRRRVEARIANMNN